MLTRYFILFENLTCGPGVYFVRSIESGFMGGLCSTSGLKCEGITLYFDNLQTNLLPLLLSGSVELSKIFEDNYILLVAFF